MLVNLVRGVRFLRLMSERVVFIVVRYSLFFFYFCYEKDNGEIMMINYN